MILLIDNHSSYIGKIAEMLDEWKIKFTIKDQKSPLSDINKNKVKGIILSGGGPNIDKKINLSMIRADLVSLLDFNLPVLGICEGHQIISEVFGGEVGKLKKTINKINKVRLLKKEAIFKGLPDIIEIKEDHGRYVKKIPEDFVLAATSKKDKIESLFHKTKPIFTIQFHPEGSGEFGEKIMKNFIDICNS